MKKELRNKAIKLRTEDRLSYSAIRKKLGVAKSTLSYWLRDYPLTEEEILELRRNGWKKGEASRERYRNTMRKKKEKKMEKFYREEKKKMSGLTSDSLYVAGLMLYLSEGAKHKSGSLNLANTDPKVINFFVNWLKKFFGVSKKDIKFQLHLYEDMDVAKEHKFWENVLAVPKRQFYKSAVRKLKKGSFSYKNSLRHGTCSAYAFGEDTRMRVMAGIKALLDVEFK